MRALIQRVTSAQVTVNEQLIGQIQQGFLVLLGIEAADRETDSTWLAQKVSRIRLFDDAEGKPNLDLAAVGGNVLVISQFTLHAATKKGNRPSFIKAARPEQAEPLYQHFVKALSEHLQKNIPTGQFGANMQVTLTNDGPVTILIDSRE